MDKAEIQKMLVCALLRKYDLNKLSYASLDHLASIIREKAVVPISSNTLARIAGVRKDQRNNYDYSLNLLADMLGFGTFENFEKFIIRNPIVQNNKPLGDKMELAFLESYAVKAAEGNDITFISALEKHIVDFGLDPASYFSIGYALMVGSRLNKNPAKLISFSTKSPILTRLFYETYVDLDFLDGYFGEAMYSLSCMSRSEASRDIFATTLAYLFKRKETRQKKARNDLRELIDIPLQLIDDLVRQREIYPTARWLRTSIDILSLTKDQQKLSRIWEYTFSLLTQVSSDDAAIILSELSELDKNSVSETKWKELTNVFNRLNNSIFFEIDCHLNTALNLTLKGSVRPLITRSEAVHIIRMHPLKFETRRKQIEKKIEVLNDPLCYR